ncbi:MAG: hypothetical protein Q7K55_08605 [Candidatus Levybacteria bacterium]|nr:hypothetical protein [Candidatus Levybacteria bacterium]
MEREKLKYLPTQELLKQQPSECVCIIEITLESRQNTQYNLAALREGRTEDLKRESVGFLMVEMLLNSNIHTQGLMPLEILAISRATRESWDKLRIGYREQVLSEELGLEIGEFNAKESLHLMFKKDWNKAGEISDKIDELTIRNPQAGAILATQAKVEEEILSYLAPHYQEVTESEFRFKYDTHEREPESIEEAKKIIIGSHAWTLKNIATYSQKNEGGVTGGFGDIYILLKQDGFFQRLFPPSLIKKSKELMERLKTMKGKNLKITIGEHEEIKEGIDPIDAIKSWKPGDQDDACRQAFRMGFVGEAFTNHFLEQAIYEKELVTFLETQQVSHQLSEPLTRQELLELLQQCHEFTKINLQTYQSKDMDGFKGGHGWFYSLLENGESANDQLTPKLIEEGFEIIAEWEFIKQDSIKEAARRTWGVDLKDIDPYKFMEDLDKSETFSSRQLWNSERRCRGLLVEDPRTVEHFKKQLEYEQRVIEYLGKDTSGN